MRGSCPKSTRASPRQCTQSATDFIQIVQFHRSYIRTREHHQKRCKVFPIFDWSPASNRIISNDDGKAKSTYTPTGELVPTTLLIKSGAFWVHCLGLALVDFGHDPHELLRFAKLRSGIFEPPFGGHRGKLGALSIPRWKARDRLPISDKWTFS